MSSGRPSDTWSVGNGECLLSVGSDTWSVLAAEKDGDKPGHRAHGHPAPSRLGPLHNSFAFRFSIRYSVSVSRSSHRRVHAHDQLNYVGQQSPTPIENYFQGDDGSETQCVMSLRSIARF
jgi:hypothetical protein